MQSFWIYFIFNIFLFLICIIGIIMSTILVKSKKEDKKLWLVIIPLIPLTLWLFTNSVIPNIKDVRYVTNRQFLVHNYTVKKVYITGKINEFVVNNGQTLCYNPWNFKPQEGKKYVLTYTPNSKFVIKAEPSNYNNK